MRMVINNHENQILNYLVYNQNTHLNVLRFGKEERIGEKISLIWSMLNQAGAVNDVENLTNSSLDSHPFP